MLGSDLIHVLCLCHKLSHKAIGPHKISRMQWVALKRNSVKDHIVCDACVCVCERERERERETFLQQEYASCTIDGNPMHSKQ